MEVKDSSQDFVWTAIHVGIFAVTALGTYLLRNKVKTGLVANSILFLLVSSTAVYYIKSVAAQTESKYSKFGVPRCASKREITSKFRQWSREVHPDQKASRDSPYTFEELDSLKDFLSMDHTRTYYDKFDVVFERDNFDETQAKTVHNYLFQRRLFSYLNTTFIWVFFTFVLCKVLRELEITNFLLKVLMGKSFVVVYFIYAQPVDECSLLDRLFPNLTMYQQIYFAEAIFALFFGIVAALVFESQREERKKLRTDVGLAKAAVDNMTSDAPALKELKESLKRFADLVNN